MKNVTIYRKIVQKTENIFQSAKKSRISNWVSWTILGVAVLAAGGAVWWSWNRNANVGVETNVTQFKVCQQNSDCVAVPDGCCGCGGGGKNIVINKKFEEEYSKKIQNECNNTGCVSFISNDPSCSGIPVCDKNKCDLAVPVDELNISALCGPEPPAVCVAGMRLTCVNGEWSCKKTEEKKKIIGKIVFSDIEGWCWGFQGDNGEHFLIGGDDKIIEEIKKIPNILSKNVEIQGKIEKDIVSSCPVGDGLFKLESYRIINNNAADISDWKTYRNEEYGFEVKYPEDWIADERALYGKFAMLQLGAINNIDYPTVPPEGMELTFHSLNDEISCFDSKKQILKFGEHNFEKCYAKDISGDLYLAQVKGEKYNYRFICILYSAKEKMCDQVLTTFKF